MSKGDYVPVPGFPELHACVRPFAAHSSRIGLCYVGTIDDLIAAGVATFEMLTVAKAGLDAAGDHYITDAHWTAHTPQIQRRYRIWRRMKRARALHMPGAHEALAHAAAKARRRQLPRQA
jgi:hypothetical protein